MGSLRFDEQAAACKIECVHEEWLLLICICCDTTDAFLERLLAKSSVTWEMIGFDLVFVAMPFMCFLTGEMAVGFDTLFIVMPLMRSQSFVGKASWKVGWALVF